MATKSILEIDSITASDVENGDLLYSEDSSVFINTGGKSNKLRQINIKDFFSKISTIIKDIGLVYTGQGVNDPNTDTTVDAGYGYIGETGTKSLDARLGKDILDRIAKAETNAKAYFDTKITEVIDELKTYIDSKMEEATANANAYTDSRIEAVIEEAKTEAVNEASAYIDSKLEEALTETKTGAINEANAYTDSKLEEIINQAKTDVNAYTDSKIEEAIAEANAYTDSKLEEMQ